ncbi:multidrug effflux MFS transporter [Persicobacter psychrovividus]
MINQAPALKKRQLILLLGAVVAMTAFSIDMYLPSIPEMAQSFTSNISTVELTISLFFIGFALGQFCGGPLSDHFGRKKVMLLGLSIYVFATSCIILTTNLHFLDMLRVMQGFGGGFTSVNVAAFVKDLYNEKESARMLSKIASVRMCAPMIAPLLGSIFAKTGHWQAVFLFLLIYCISILTGVYRKIPLRSMPKETNKSVWSSFGRYKKIVANQWGICYILTGTFALCGLYAFMSKATSIFVDTYHVSAQLFPWLFTVCVLGMIIISRWSQYLLKNFESKQMVQWGITICLLSGFILFAMVEYKRPNLWLLLSFNVIFVSALGFIFGHINGCILSCYPGATGTANASYGLVRFSIAGIIGSLIHWMGQGVLNSTYEMMFGCALLSNICFYGLRPRTASFRRKKALSA